MQKAIISTVAYRICPSKVFCWLLFPMVLAFSIPGTATSLDHRTHEALEEILKKYSKSDRLSGVLEVMGPNFKFVKHLNYADDHRLIDNGPDVSYVIASTSKQWIAAALLRLEEQGRLQLEDPLSQYFPEFPAENLKGSNGEVVRLCHLLNHTSGLFEAYDEKSLDDRVLFQPLTFQDILAVLIPRLLTNNPGTTFSYSDSGYDILAEVIRRVSGTSYTSVMTSMFFGPLGLSGTTVGFVPGRLRQIARSYDSQKWPRKDHFKASGEKFELMNEDLAAGNIMSSTQDLTKWLQALIHGKVLSESSLNRLWTASSVHSYGLGWYIDNTSYPRPVYSHQGSWVGYTSLIAVSPSQKASIVWLSNGSLSQEKTSKFYEELMDVVFKDEDSTTATPYTGVTPPESKLFHRIFGNFRKLRPSFFQPQGLTRLTYGQSAASRRRNESECWRAGLESLQN